MVKKMIKTIRDNRFKRDKYQLIEKKIIKLAFFLEIQIQIQNEIPIDRKQITKLTFFLNPTQIQKDIFSGKNDLRI